MQPGKNPTEPTDDLHKIMGRFQSWAGTESPNGNGKDAGVEGVREIPYEEALRQIRSRRAELAKPGGATAAAPKAAAAVATAAAPKATAAAALRPAAAAFARSAAWLSAAPAEAAPEETELAVTPKAVATRTVAPGTVATKKTSAPVVAIAKTRDAVTARASAGKKAKTQRTTQPVSTAAVKPAAMVKRAGPAVTARVEAAAIPKKRKPEVAPARKKQAKKAAAPVPEFRTMLVKSIRQAKPAQTARNKRKAERELRVSVRLTDTEEQELQACAAREGLTVSAYLRRRALEPAVSGENGRAEPPVQQRAAAGSGEGSAAKPAKSGFGDWMTMLRNRFLASPGRFAERA